MLDFNRAFGGEFVLAAIQMGLKGDTLLSHFAELHRRRPYDEWIYDWCIPWVERCDLILRLPGTSKGADIEVQHALKHGIEVYFGWEDLKSSI